MRALRARSPQLTKAEAQEAFDRAVLLLESAKALVVTHRGALDAAWDGTSFTCDLSKVDEELASRFTDIPPETCSSAVQWALYWHHLR